MRLKRKIRKLFYRWVHGINIDALSGTHHPQLGKGKYVSVYKKGVYTDIVDEQNKHTLRLIPYSPNHGVFIEALDEKGAVISRRRLNVKAMKEYLLLKEEKNNKTL